MHTFGDRDPVCGTVACLGGHAMLQSPGYRLDEYSVFRRPDGTAVVSEGDEAQELLGLPDSERGLFIEWDHGRAIERFRALVEAAEAAAS